MLRRAKYSAIFLLLMGSLAFGQHRPWASNLILPQCRSLARSGVVRVERVDAKVTIVEQIATTRVSITVINPHKNRQTAELVMPVPVDASVHSFRFAGSAEKPTFQILGKTEAKSAFQSIVARLKDPALLEFAGNQLVRSSVFPVEPGKKQTIELIWEQVLKADGNRIDYSLPRSESVLFQVPWNIEVSIRAKSKIASVYSPSHMITQHRSSDTQVMAKTPKIAEREPGSFRLSYLMDKNDVNATLFAFPGKNGQEGYFLLLAGLGKDKAKSSHAKRELTLVIDHSGSMKGQKIKQAQEAALQIIHGLNDGETFNIIVYNDQIDKFAAQPVKVNEKNVQEAEKFVNSLKAVSGTNIHDALKEALTPKPSKNSLPIVLFLTDGLPTVGIKNEVQIREMCASANQYSRRIFSFGVGLDVNTPLLNAISLKSRSFATFVLPSEDVEVKVGKVFRGLSGPQLASPKLATVNGKGKKKKRISDVFPRELPDLFTGDQWVVLGRYRGNKSLNFVIEGMQGGAKKKYEFSLKVNKASRQFTFVPRLWATRKIAELTENVRELGATSFTSFKPATSRPAKPDARLKELTDEIVRLSREFGILTEYTSFLAKEGTDLTQKEEILSQAQDSLKNRALATRSGAGSVNQELNTNQWRNLVCVNNRNTYWSAGLHRVATASIQQVSDQAFYRRSHAWVDSRLVQNASAKPSKVVEFGTKEFMEIAWKLATQGRQNTMSLNGNVLLEIDGVVVLLKNPAHTAAKKNAAVKNAYPQQQGR